MLAAPPPGRRAGRAGLGARIAAFMQEAEGAYSLVVLTRDAVYAVRDPLGPAPAVPGRTAPKTATPATWWRPKAARWRPSARSSCARSSPARSCAWMRTACTRRRAVPRQTPSALCIFEYVYFARPDSLLEGQTVHRVRQRLGEELAREAPVEADMVIGVPDSATPAAIGYAQVSGIPFSEGLIKNRYIGRTFIQPDDRIRRVGVHLKYNPLTANLRGKRVVLIDDSIVRGNTIKPLLTLLREGGATEVHVRVSSPPVRHPCFMGIDMATHEELIAHNRSIAEIQAQIGADSLAYLSHAGMMRAVRAGLRDDRGHCSACFSGRYPIDLEEWWAVRGQEKLAFEQMWGS